MNGSHGKKVNKIYSKMTPNRAFCDIHIETVATYHSSLNNEYWCKAWYEEFSSRTIQETDQSDVDFIDNKITSFYVKWNNLKEEIVKWSSKHEKALRNYNKLIKYLTRKFNKPFLFPDISAKKLLKLWEKHFKEIKLYWKNNKLKELIITNDKYTNFCKRFNRNSCDIKKSISAFLNSPDVKEEIEMGGPYFFKDLTNQDQLILMDLKYEGRIAELEDTVEKQKLEISRLKSVNGELTKSFDQGRSCKVSFTLVSNLKNFNYRWS